MKSDHAFVIPVYRESPYLGTCIESLLEQTQPSPIVLCTSTPSIFLERISDRYGLLLRVNPVRSHIAGDWNFALTSSDCDLVTIAHQDDVYQPGYAAAIRAAIRQYPHASMVYTNYTEHTPDGPRPPNLNLWIKRGLNAMAFGSQQVLNATRGKRLLLRMGNPICCPSVTFNRRLIPEFRFLEAFLMNLDWDAWARLAEAPGAFVYLRQALVSHRVHPGTETTASLASGRRQHEDLLMFRRFWGVVPARLIQWMYQASYRANRT